ncbi:glycogen-binding domain-containing protein [Candidatus Bipolaricaulota sp. J31]
MRRVTIVVLAVLIGIATWAVECPPGQVPVTFRYIPLPGEEVTSVSLRGTFNDWGEWPMEKQPDGSWAITVCLAPGVYEYKYFIDGQWPKDMSTARGGGPVDFDADGYVDDGFGGKNAIRKVGSSISGEWDFKMRLVPDPLVDHNTLKLTCTFAGYDLTGFAKFGWDAVFEEVGFELAGLPLGMVELKSGMYFDPAAPAYKHTFAEGKVNLMGVELTGKLEHWADPYLPDDRCPVPVTFRYVPAPGETVTSVNVAGDFDGWNPSDPETEMRYDPATGEWSVTIYLTPGPIRYKYVINGSWPGSMRDDHPVTGGPIDPDLPTGGDAYLYYVDDGFGGLNATRVIRANCPRADTVPVTFRYIPAPGETVTSVNVAGDFDGWNPSDAETAMTYDPATGEWSVTIYLTPGPHQYKYVINGSWPGNMATDHPVSGGPVDPDADGYAYGSNAVRLVGDLMPSYMRYTMTAEWGNFEGTLRFEDCCCGIVFKDLTLKASDLSLCCGLTYDAEFYFTKYGFRHVKFTADSLFELCCGIGVGLDVVFGVDYKRVTPKFSWGGITGCVDVYGDAQFGGNILSGFEVYGFKLRCELAKCNWIEILTAFDVAKIEEIFQADIFFDNEFQYIKFGTCGPACCGGNWDLTLTAFFGGGGLFDITRIWLDINVPLTDAISIVANISPTLGELYFGWTWKF